MLECDAEVVAYVVEPCRGQIGPAMASKLDCAEIIKFWIIQAVKITCISYDANVKGGVVGQNNVISEARFECSK
jgi:hypothetical protein